MDVKVVEMPEGVDPADLISKSGVGAWREAIKNSKHIIEFLLNKVLRNYKDDLRKAAREIKEKILPFVNAVGSSMEKMYFLKNISDLSGIPINALEDDLKKIEQEFKYETEEIKEVGDSLAKIYRKDRIERNLLGIAFWQQTLPEPKVDFKRIFDKLGDLGEKYKDNKEDIMFEAEISHTNNENLEKDVDEMFLNFDEENINEELSKKMMELKRVPDEESGKKILQEMNELIKKKENIKNGRLNKV